MPGLRGLQASIQLKEGVHADNAGELSSYDLTGFGNLVETDVGSDGAGTCVLHSGLVSAGLHGVGVGAAAINDYLPKLMELSRDAGPGSIVDIHDFDRFAMKCRRHIEQHLEHGEFDEQAYRAYSRSNPIQFWHRQEQDVIRGLVADNTVQLVRDSVRRGGPDDAHEIKTSVSFMCDA